MPSPLRNSDCVSFHSLASMEPPPGVLEQAASAAAHRTSLSVGPYQIEICSDSQHLAAALKRRYHDFSGMQFAGSTNLRLWVTRHGQRLLFWTDPTRVKYYEIAESDVAISVFLTDLVLAYELFNFYPIMSLHAAVVGTHNRVAAILGDSTAGKSTTAVACGGLGYTFYSDERCVLERGVLYPFPRALTLRQGGRACLLADNPAPAKRLSRLLADCPTDRDVQVIPSMIFDSMATRHGKLDVLFLLQGFAEQPEAKEVGLAQHLPQIMRAVMLCELGIDRVTRVLSELAGVRVFTLVLGSPWESAQKIQKVMQSL